MILKQTNKFKSIVLSVRFKETIIKENLGLRALLPHLLTNRTKTYKTKKSLNEALNNLYGAKLASKVSRFGNLSIVDVSFSIVHPSIIGIKAFKEGLSLFYEAVFLHPNLPKKDFEIEKRQYIESLQALKNNKTAYAVDKMKSLMFKDENFGLNIRATLKDIEAITYNKLNNYYKKVIKENDYNLLVSGNLTANLLKEINQYFTPRANNNLNPIDYETKEVNGLVKHEEVDHINQAKLNIGYRLPIRYKDPLQTAAVLFNITLGGAVHSRLFLNVREKHSLCYYISSTYDSNKGFCFIYSGVDKLRVDLALKEINKQIKDLQTNLISQEELNKSKQHLINLIKENDDNQILGLQVLFQQTLLNNVRSIKTRIQQINNVTPQDIKAVAKLLIEDTLYILSPEA